MRFYLIILLLVCLVTSGISQENINNSKFKQLGTDLPSPNSYRTASGAPGHEYWQQQADYKMDIEIDDDNETLSGEETITYHNNSPDQLSYLWLQLDQNVRSKESATHAVSNNSLNDRMSLGQLNRLMPAFEGGFNIEHVKDANGNNLPFLINNTMMRVDMPSVLKTGQTFTFNIKWWYNINNTNEIGGRSGYEPFDDGNNVYCIAQFFPRLCVYDDKEGWQNKQFLGRGEFALTFGDYDVSITVPSDHLVSSTGELQNASKVLSREQRNRLKEAEDADVNPVIIASMDEANSRSESKSTKNKTWHYQAENVRDFAFASSRRFIWDALGVKMSDGRTVMAQSMWTKEGDCLWSKYSTKAVAHTIKWYSYYLFDYPYPAAWSVDGDMGMEYPMMAFNYGRCADDDTYSQRMKYGHIGVIIHEVGHNWFPMIVNSDERQWTWMDEGLNSFTQYLAEQQWSRTWPHRRGPARNITGYMGGDKSNIVPIMTNSESIPQFGNNAYGKPATALNILRETVMGREQFDYAFKEYANRWAFKHPSPADFFRTMEDASGTDLDWFWRGWFYTNDNVDVNMSSVNYFKAENESPDEKSETLKSARGLPDISEIRNETDIPKTQEEIDNSIIDFYTTYDPLDVDDIDREEYEAYVASLSPEEKAILESDENYYEITFENKGGLVMPIIIQLDYIDGTSEIRRYPAEIWKMNNTKITKIIPTSKEVKQITLDPYQETADTDTSNNYYPPKQDAPSRFEVFKRNQGSRGASSRENPMQRAKRAEEKKKVIKP